ncbi:unnamed protein product [Rhodiola kirilowii]
MANNTRQASIADLEARTTVLESETKEIHTDLKNLDAKVDHIAADLAKGIQAVQASVDRLAAQQNVPMVPRALDRGKGIMGEETSEPLEETRVMPPLPHVSHPTYEGAILNTCPRGYDELIQERRRRAPYIDPYLGERLEVESEHRCNYPQMAWGAAREVPIQPRPIWEFDTRHRRLELPVFQGEDVRGWLHRAERYFLVNDLTNLEKLDAAILCMEGKALHWTQWKEERQPFYGWDEFKIGLLKRF